MLKKILIFTTQGGHGHRASAQALSAAIKAQNLPWTVIQADFFATLQNTDNHSHLWAKLSQKMTVIYNTLIQCSWGRGILAFLSKVFIPPYKKFLENKIINQITNQGANHPFITYLQEQKPDLVISVASLINTCLGQIMAQFFPQIPVAVIATDFDEGFPGMWLGPDQLHYLLGTDLLQIKAKNQGYTHTYPLPGLMINPSFCVPTNQDKKNYKKRLGLHPDKPTALILFGGYGDSLMLRVAKKVANHPSLQCIFICGHNHSLYEDLKKIPFQNPSCIAGFTDTMVDYMQAADFFIGKPGPGCVSEAISQYLPVLIQTGWTTLLQEKAVVDWVQRRTLGLTFYGLNDLLIKIEKMLENLEFYTNHTKKIPPNTAVFESLTILQKFM